MRAVKVAIASTVLGALVVLAAGCGGADPEAAKTPTDAVTITNGQRDTDTGGDTGDDPNAAGKAVFEASCQGCHPAGGTAPGAGPVLENIGRSSEQIHKQVEEGGGAMPGGLVSGQELEDVVAYVTSLQGDAAPAPAGGETTTDATPAPTETTGSTPKPAPAPAEGDVAAGKTFFETTCQGCHPAGGTSAGAGPALKGIGWTPEQIEKQIVDGGVAMPPGLASGSDLTNVVAFVASLQ